VKLGNSATVHTPAARSHEGRALTGKLLQNPQRWIGRHLPYTRRNAKWIPRWKQTSCNACMCVGQLQHERYSVLVGCTEWGRSNRGSRTPFDSHFVACTSLLRTASRHLYINMWASWHMSTSEPHYKYSRNLAWLLCSDRPFRTSYRTSHRDSSQLCCVCVSVCVCVCEINYLYLSFPTTGNNNMAAALTFNAGATVATAYVVS
jgi:hypothetical protein